MSDIIVKIKTNSKKFKEFPEIQRSTVKLRRRESLLKQMSKLRIASKFREPSLSRSTATIANSVHLPDIYLSEYKSCKRFSVTDGQTNDVIVNFENDKNEQMFPEISHSFSSLVAQTIDLNTLTRTCKNDIRKGKHLWKKVSHTLTLPLLYVEIKNKKRKKQFQHQLSKKRLKLNGLYFQRNLLNKFRRAVRLCIFCSRNFKEHCLRNKENDDELAPYIKNVQFHDDDNPDLLIDLSQFKANRQLRISDETKRILMKEVDERTEQEIYSGVIALRNIKCFGEYPHRMQKKIAEVGLYERYESKRVIVRQGHPASGFYFILSGSVIVMVTDMESKYTRPVAHMYKGQTFGELAIINGSKRNSTVICKETCEFLSISARNYHKIFMAGGVKNINDPDQEIFLKSLSCLSDWPIHLLQENPTKCQFMFFKNAEILTRDTHYSDWVIIVKSGSVQVLKKLKKVEAFEWKKKAIIEPITGKEKRETGLKRMDWRRILPELRVPLHEDDEDGNVVLLNNGHPAPFEHPSSKDGSQASTSSSPNGSPRVPNLWPFRVDVTEVEYGKYIDDGYHTPYAKKIVAKTLTNDTRKLQPNLQRINSKHLEVNPAYRRKSVIQEEEKELLGYQPHIRTIMEDIDAGGTNKDEEDVNPADINPEFVHVQTLTKGQVYGLADVIIGDQPSFSVISKGADCLLINKQFYLEHASEKLLREMRQELCPYPSDLELQQRLQVSVDWHAYRKETIEKSLENVGLRRHMRSTVKGTKVQEAF